MRTLIITNRITNDITGSHVTSAIIWWMIHLSIIWTMVMLSHAKEINDAPPSMAVRTIIHLLHARRSVHVLSVSFLMTVLSWAWVRASDPGRAERHWRKASSKSKEVVVNLGASTGTPITVARERDRPVSEDAESNLDLEMQSMIEVKDELGGDEKPCRLCGAGQQIETTKHCKVVGDTRVSL